MKRSYKATSLRNVLGVGQKEAKKGEGAGERVRVQGGTVSPKPGLKKDGDVKTEPTGVGDEAGSKTGGAEGEELEGWIAVNDPAPHHAKGSVTEPGPAAGDSSRAG